MQWPSGLSLQDKQASKTPNCSELECFQSQMVRSLVVSNFLVLSTTRKQQLCRRLLAARSLGVWVFGKRFQWQSLSGLLKLVMGAQEERRRFPVPPALRRHRSVKNALAAPQAVRAPFV
jgi:hypothetical protein